MRLRGAGALPYGVEELDVAKIRGDNREPRAAFIAYRLGLELHVKHRFGLFSFLEKVPAFSKSKVLGSYDILGMSFQAWGLGMVVKW